MRHEIIFNQNSFCCLYVIVCDWNYSDPYFTGVWKYTAKRIKTTFSSSNVIITDDGTPYIIDWSHATQGNASADAARTYLLFWLNGDIDAAKKYLNLFCEKSDTAIQYVQKWMPIVAASQTVKGNAAEREFLHSWIDVVDYS